MKNESELLDKCKDTTERIDTDIIIHNGEKIKVNLQALISESDSLKLLYESKDDILTLNSPFSNEHFVTFAHFCALVNPIFNAIDPYIVMSCADYFEANKLMYTAINYIHEYRSHLITIDMFNKYIKEGRYVKGFYRYFAIYIEEFADDSIFSNIDTVHLPGILNHPELSKLPTHKLTSFLLTRINQSKNFDLIRMINFSSSNIKGDDIQKLIDKARDMGLIGHMHLLKSIKKARSDKIASGAIKVKVSFAGNNYFNGIFKRMKQMNNCNNLILDGIIKFYSPTNCTNKLFEPAQKNYIATHDELLSSFIIKLKDETEISIKGYRLKKTHKNWPTDWIVEASRNGVLWHLIDKVEKHSDPSKRTYCKEILSNYPENFTMVRITQTSPNISGRNVFAIQNLELFGKIIKCDDKYPYTESEHATGILYALSRDDKVIAYLSSNSPHVLLDHQTCSSWSSAYIKMQGAKTIQDQVYFDIDFNKYKVDITSYVIKTINSPKDYGHLKSWVLLGSNDGISFTEIDRRVNEDGLNYGSVFLHFSIRRSSQNSKTFFRVIRLALLDKNHSGDFVININSIELFGSIVLPLYD